MHHFSSMQRLRILRRPDGVIELRRRGLRDSAVVRDAAILAGLCLVCVVSIAVLAAILVETPLLLAATGALVLPVAAAALLARSAELVHASAHPPRPRPPGRAA
jgi:hypothetical protein